MKTSLGLYLCIGLLAAPLAQAQNIRITPLTNANFGTVAVGSSQTLTFDLDSAGATDSLRSLVQSANTGDMWGTSPAPGFTLNAGNCIAGGGVPGGTALGSGVGCRFSVTFEPSAIGPAGPAYVVATTHQAGHWANLALSAAGGMGQTIAFTSTPPVSAFAGGPGYSLASDATSGLPATYSVDPASSAVCFLIGGYVELTAPGTCTVYANQAGNATYAPAPRVQQSFAVAAAAPVVPANPASIPTLSQWGLIFMAGLLAMLGLRRIK